MNNVLWSKEENDALRKIAEHGGTMEDAVLIINRTRQAITCHVSSLGLSLAGGVKEINKEAFKKFLKERGR